MILVLGATGRVGAEVVRLLALQGTPVRCLARDVQRAAGMARAGIEVVQGDLDDAAGLHNAFDGIEQLFLMSPVGERMAAQQLAAVAAAHAAGVARIVKLSGSSWTMQDGAATVSGAAHAEVENAIRACAIAHVFLRPNVFMQGMLARLPLELAAGDTFTLALGDAAAAFIDARDIAAVATRCLQADDLPAEVLDLSGPAAVSGGEIASIASALTGRAITYQAVPADALLSAARGRGESAFVLRHLAQVLNMIAMGAASATSAGVAALCGRPAHSVADWLGATLRN